MSKIGFFGGSFNPPTIAHINLARKIVNKYNLEKIVFVPMGNFYEKQGLIDFNHRYKMLDLICRENKKLEVSDIENNQKEKLYAIDVFRIIKNKYSKDDIYFIMGTDNLDKIRNWKAYNELVTQYQYIILERENNEFNNIIENNEEIKKYKDNFLVMSDEKYMNISSSIVREKIKNKEDIHNLIPNEIENYIQNNNLYED